MKSFGGNRSAMAKAVFLCVLSAALMSLLWATFRDSLDPDISDYDFPVRRIIHNASHPPRIDDRHENIFWVVQISDLHISQFQDLKRGPDLILFCQDYLSRIKPELVLVTGDLTDAKDENGIKTKQFKEEWIAYQNFIRQCRTFTQAVFLDTRGNHDSFDVSDLNGQDNLFRQFGVRGPDHSSSYRYEHKTEFGKYSFIAVDACPNPGPRRPFNFFGHIDDERIRHLSYLALESQGSNMTVWFGHYPTSMIVQDPPGIRHVLRDGAVYVCGHLHTLGGFVPRMYAHHKIGILELELGDWKDNRIFRVLAIDHDLLSFVDHRIGEWPLILVTNPKDSHFLIPSHEPVESIGYSTHIRMLIFNQYPVVDVKVFIDNEYVGQAVQGKESLYTLPWNPDKYKIGQHSLAVTVKDASGKVKTIQQSFSVDGSRTGFPLVPRFILMMNIFTLGKVAFGLLVFMYVLLFASLHQIQSVRYIQIPGRNYLTAWINVWLYRLWLVSKMGPVYYLLLAFLIYITFGPWFVGNLLKEHTGVIFVWGTFVKGTFLPGSLNYFYGIFQVLSFNIPLVLILGITLDMRRHQLDSVNIPAGRQRFLYQRILMADIPFLFLLLFQAYVALTEFPKNYGTTALVISPVRVGSLLVAVILMYLAHTVPVKKICSINGRLCQ